MYAIGDKIKTWLPPDTIEEAARKQLINIANIPFVFKHLAVMPDCHLGMGATVGSVIATKGAIIPAAVGVDIGCGMVAVRTCLSAAALPDNLKDIRLGIERRIPLGAGGNNSKFTRTAEKRIAKLQESALMAGVEPDGKWREQVGTLGSGNHFIELCLDGNEQVWVVLHSGSRGIGNRIAQKHIKVAKQLMKNFHVDLADPDLAYLPEQSPEFNAYIREMLWAQDFAWQNRDEMMDRVMTELSYALCGEDGHQAELEVDRINCHHNFTQQEEHFGQAVWLTRKGAIQMRKGQMGVIPGSMGTRSYIVSGLENKMAFHSAPHGAGRRFSRTQARKQFTMEDYDRDMKGIECRRSPALIDELPGAYKDIDQVMENSRDLVQIEYVLHQVLSVKGD